MYETSEDELRKTMEKTNNLIESILKKKPCLASECKIENLDNINAGSKFHHDWLLVKLVCYCMLLKTFMLKFLSYVVQMV